MIARGDIREMQAVSALLLAKNCPRDDRVSRKRHNRASHREFEPLTAGTWTLAGGLRDGHQALLTTHSPFPHGFAPPLVRERDSTDSDSGHRSS